MISLVIFDCDGVLIDSEIISASALVETLAGRRRTMPARSVSGRSTSPRRERGEWQGVVRVAEHLGSDTFLHIDAEAIGRVTARAPGELALTAGDKVGLTPRADRVHRFDNEGRAMRA